MPLIQQLLENIENFVEKWKNFSLSFLFHFVKLVAKRSNPDSGCHVTESISSLFPTLVYYLIQHPCLFCCRSAGSKMKTFRNRYGAFLDSDTF